MASRPKAEGRGCPRLRLPAAKNRKAVGRPKVLSGPIQHQHCTLVCGLALLRGWEGLVVASRQRRDCRKMATAMLAVSRDSQKHGQVISGLSARPRHGILAEGGRLLVRGDVRWSKRVIHSRLAVPASSLMERLKRPCDGRSAGTRRLLKVGGGQIQGRGRDADSERQISSTVAAAQVAISNCRLTIAARNAARV